MSADDLARVRLIADARASGLTWAQIAPTLGCTTPQEAKAKAHRLRREVQKAVLREEVPGE